MNRYQHACYVNAKMLLRSSKLLFEKRLYGPSSALSVLAIEECGKGFIFMIETPNKKNESYLRKRISDHRNKLLLSAKDAYLMGLMHEGYFTKEKPVSIEEFQDKAHRLLRTNKRFAKLVTDSYLIQDLNPLKKKGLYVDFDGEEILSPKSISRKEARFALEQADRVVRYFPKTHGMKVKG
ncbi:MAG: AbiV family abortive infection protein [Nitrosarchaeum sp.]